MKRARLDQPFVSGVMETAVGPVPRVGSTLTRADRLGMLKVRSGIGRDSYTIDPGLYALGEPEDDAPVLVTANYKLTFDVVRSSLPGLDAWILVLDTRGINVWCAAGKHTFSTDELVARLAFDRPQSVVAHRRVIVPQLGAVGVAAHEVRSRSGFTVVWGPVRISDLPAFLTARMKASPEMRRVAFPLRDRLVLSPVEIAGALKLTAWVLAAFLALALVQVRPLALGAVLLAALANAAPFLAGVLAGTVLTPALLPWLPGRAFAAKGALLGALAGAATALALGSDALGMVWAVLVAAAISSYAAMNFTGSSTFTSMSGVEKEMRRWMPLQGGAAALAVVALVVKVVAR
jgi:hypothetical protein